MQTNSSRTREGMARARGAQKQIPLSVRFWRNVRMSDRCWEWTAKSRVRGYGVIGRGKRSEGKVLAHRLSWEWSNGPIPDGMAVLHACDNPLCVRPSHLFLGTQTDNMRDMDAKRRRAPNQNANATHCVHGHEFTRDNTYRYKGRRKCRACMNSRSRKWRASQ